MGLGSAPQPMRTVMPNMGVNYGIDLGNEIQAGSQLGSGSAAASSAGFLTPDVVQIATVSLTAAQILGMYATPVQLVAAPGAGKSIVLHRLLLRLVYGTTQFASGGTVSAEYDSVAHAAGTLATGTIAAATINAAASSDNMLPGIAVAPTQNKGLFISNATGAFTTGDSTATVYVWYSII